MDVLRARAYLDLLLDKDSRPGQDTGRQDAAGGRDGTAPGGTSPDGPGEGGSRPDEPGAPGRPPGTGAVPAGFVGRINVTVPLVTLLGRADRPGVSAYDLACRSAYCLTCRLAGGLAG